MKQWTKDRIEGIGKQAAGSIKEVADKVTGAANIQAEGRRGGGLKGQNAVGGAKDAARDTLR